MSFADFLSEKGENFSISVPKRHINEIINVYFAILINDVVENIKNTTDSISILLTKEDNHEGALEQLQDVKKDFDEYKKIIDHISENVEEYIFLDSGQTRITFPLNKSIKGSEFNKMFKESREKRNEKQEKIKKRIQKKKQAR